MQKLVSVGPHNTQINTSIPLTNKTEKFNSWTEKTLVIEKK